MSKASEGRFRPNNPQNDDLFVSVKQTTKCSTKCKKEENRLPTFPLGVSPSTWHSQLQSRRTNFTRAVFFCWTHTKFSCGFLQLFFKLAVYFFERCGFPQISPHQGFIFWRKLFHFNCQTQPARSVWLWGTVFLGLPFICAEIPWLVDGGGGRSDAGLLTAFRWTLGNTLRHLFVSHVAIQLHRKAQPGVQINSRAQRRWRWFGHAGRGRLLLQGKPRTLAMIQWAQIIWKACQHCLRPQRTQINTKPQIYKQNEKLDLDQHWGPGVSKQPQI